MKSQGGSTITIWTTQTTVNVQYPAGFYTNIEVEGNPTPLPSAKSIFPADSVFAAKLGNYEFHAAHSKVVTNRNKYSKNVSMYLEQKGHHIDRTWQGDETDKVALIAASSKKSMFDAIASL